MTVVMVWNRLACDEPCCTVLAGSLDRKRKGLMNAIILNAPLKEGMVLFCKAFLRYSSLFHHHGSLLILLNSQP